MTSTASDVVHAAGVCPACGSDCNERDELFKAEREIERLLGELGQLRHQFDRTVKLADDRLIQMKADSAQALRWRDELDQALTVCRCAARVIGSSAYQGVSDEDCDLENAVRNWRASMRAHAECWCQTCRPVTMGGMRMVLCPDCGNKRCPKANNHLHVCTDSNAPGQPGSAYP